MNYKYNWNTNNNGQHLTNNITEFNFWLLFVWQFSERDKKGTTEYIIIFSLFWQTGYLVTAFLKRSKIDHIKMIKNDKTALKS